MNAGATTARRGLPFLALAAILWGTVPVATGAIYRLAATNALSIGFLRLALSLIFLIPITYLVSGAQSWRLPRKDLAIILLFGLAMALYQVCYFAAIPLVGVTIAALVTLCTAPVMVALLGAFLLEEHITAPLLLAMVAAIAGTVLLVGSHSLRQGAPAFHGILLSLGAALGFAIVALCTRALTPRYHSLQLITIGMGAGTLMLLPFALYSGLVLTYPPPAWLLLLHLGLLPTALGYVFFFHGLRFTEAAVASIVNLLEPLTSTILAWLLFGEQLGSRGIVGAALLLSAMAILFRRSPGHESG